MLTQYHYNRRLLKLADYLDTVPAEDFDYDRWGVQTPCGTVACALGHAVLGPFKGKGFKMAPGPYTDDSCPILQFQRTTSDYVTGPADVSDELFGPDTFELFIPQNGREAKAKPATVAKKIRDFVAARTRG